MRQIRIITDLRECRRLWEQVIPKELVSDLWQVRACFQNQYGHPPCFILAEEDGNITGFLPLSWNNETGHYNYFPGETWEGKTWLEQNRIIVKDRHTLDAMLAGLDKPYHLRYLRKDGNWDKIDEGTDETGYLFIPDNYDYDMDRYFDAFSHKTSKKLKKELAVWDNHKVEWRFDKLEDFEILCQMNISRYGRLSYFHDNRFLESFRSLLRFLDDQNWLRIVTVIVDGVPAAVDMGSLYNGMLTMLAGGTNGDFRGIAKLINIHHMTYVCENRLDSVDFLCGDFNWKTLFHLTPAPLYVLEGNPEAISKKALAASNYFAPRVPVHGMRGAPHA
ncbi:MAG: GNAT family N-acetyltransferase [Candidatus Zixiibacteriota bacterium]